MTRKQIPLTLAVCWLIAVSALAQESPTYADEYALYQRAAAETNADARKALLLEFVQTYSESALDENVSYLWAQYFEPHRKQGNWSQVARLAEEYLAYRPGDKNSMASATEAYQKMGQPQKLAEFGSRLYQQSPSASTAYLVAKAYQTMGNRASFKTWADRTLRHDPNNLEMLVELINTHWSSGDLPGAAGYAERTLAAAEKSSDQAGQAGVKAFSERAIGESAYVQNDFQTAGAHFERATGYDPKDEFSHFRLGYCQWRTGRIDDAILSFAKAHVLGGANSRTARTELYKLVRERYSDTTRVAQILSAARAELGIQ